LSYCSSGKAWQALRNRMRISGLGCSKVYGIVRQIGGDVTIDTAVGEGTRISIALPVLRRKQKEYRAQRCVARLRVSANRGW
jgi:signal transduction histidine kinase